MFPPTNFRICIHVSVCAHALTLYRHEGLKDICIRWRSCSSFQPVTAQRTGLSSSNERHMCSRRLNLLRAHLLLAKHFHPLLNISVSFLWAGPLSMCAAWMNVHNVCFWVLVYAGKSVFFLYSLLHPVSSLSSPYPLYLSISLPVHTLSVVRQISTLCASSNNDPDVNLRVWRLTETIRY